MFTVLDIIQKTSEFFSTRGIENPRLNAEIVTGHALGLKRMQLYLQFERLLTEPELERIRPLVRRRAQHEPLQYILGEVEWFNLRLKVDRRALIPRPETERLAEIVTELLPAPPTRILDMGTGTGALALGLLKHWPSASAVAADLSEDALALAAENAAKLELAGRIGFIRSDWFASIGADERFDLIVANPPYLTAEEVRSAAAEVREHEPRSALESPDDGLADLGRIVESAAAHLPAGALLALETGVHHHPALLELCARSGFARADSRQDLAGRDRYIFAWR